jgi:GTP-binding protein HflX
MDLYEQKNFDEFLPQEVKKSLLQELEQSWMAKTNDNAIFVSATANRNTAELREKIFRKVKELYLVRYPYKAGYWSEYF